MPPLIICINNRSCLAEVLQGSCGMEDPQSSECAATFRCDNDRESVRDGIGVDVERQHQRISSEGGRRGSAGTSTFSVQMHYQLFTDDHAITVA